MEKEGLGLYPCPSRGSSILASSNTKASTRV